MIPRMLMDELLAAAREFPVVTLFGPRQSGKTTLARVAFPDKRHVSLEDPDTRLLAERDPRGFLAGLSGGAILDEVQRLPQLAAYLQGIVDEDKRPGQWVLTGSHQPLLDQTVNQSLAGRTAVLLLLPCCLSELRLFRAPMDAFVLAVQGCYPGPYDQQLSFERFFAGYVQTYLERDVRSLLNVRDLSLFQQFLVLLAGRVGQVLNHAALSNDLGVSATTVRQWLSVLKASYVVFELAPYFENIRKRVIKSPKIYFCDPGLAAHLAGIWTPEQIQRDRLRGGLYENLLVAEVLKLLRNHGRSGPLYFYRDSNGNEVDLLVPNGRRLVPVEIKSAATWNEGFLAGIQRFRAVAGDARVAPGAVLYNGPHDTRVDEVRLFNPLQHEGLESLVLEPWGAEK
jgi:predicted AAA+ superfamily ATPase